MLSGVLQRSVEGTRLTDLQLSLREETPHAGGPRCEQEKVSWSRSGRVLQQESHSEPPFPPSSDGGKYLSRRQKSNEMMEMMKQELCARHKEHSDIQQLLIVPSGTERRAG